MSGLIDSILVLILISFSILYSWSTGSFTRSWFPWVAHNFIYVHVYCIIYRCTREGDWPMYCHGQLSNLQFSSSNSLVFDFIFLLHFQNLSVITSAIMMRWKSIVRNLHVWVYHMGKHEMPLESCHLSVVFWNSKLIAATEMHFVFGWNFLCQLLLPVCSILLWGYDMDLFVYLLNLLSEHINVKLAVLVAPRQQWCAC